MSQKLATLLVALCCAHVGAGFAMTKDEHKAKKESIETEYKAAHEKCKSLKANAKDVCEAEAKGMQKVANAELEAQYKPGTKADAHVRDVKADAAYNVSKEKCDDLSGNARSVCVKDAKAAKASAKGKA